MTHPEMSDSIQERQNNTTRETLLRVCADWNLLSKELRAEGIIALMGMLTDLDRLARTLDVVGFNWSRQETTPRNLPGLIVHHYRDGIVPAAGYKPYEERWLKPAKPLVDFDQPEFELDAPPAFQDAWERFPEDVQKFFRCERPRLHECANRAGGRDLIVECEMSNAAELLNSHFRDPLRNALQGAYVDVRAMGTCDFLNYAKR